MSDDVLQRASQMAKQGLISPEQFTRIMSMYVNKASPQSDGYPSFTGGLSDPDWVNNLPSEYGNFRKSDNVDDRRGDSWLKSWGSGMLAGIAQLLPSNAELKAAVSHPLTPIWQSMASDAPLETSLSKELGSSSIGRSR